MFYGGYSEVATNAKNLKYSNRLLKAVIYVDICKSLMQFYDAVSVVGNNFSESVFILFLNCRIGIRNRVGEEDPVCSLL